MSTDCKATLKYPVVKPCPRYVTHPSGYCTEHRSEWRPDLTEKQAKAPQGIVSSYTQGLNLMSTSQSDGYRSLNYGDAQAIAALAYAEGLKAAVDLEKILPKERPHSSTWPDQEDWEAMGYNEALADVAAKIREATQ